MASPGLRKDITNKALGGLRGLSEVILELTQALGDPGGGRAL